MPLEVMTNTLPTKGKLVYEYNPFHNYRLSKTKYLYKNNYYTIQELEDKFKLVPVKKDDNNYIKITNSEDYRNAKYWALETSDKLEVVNVSIELHEKGELLDFDTDELQFTLDHPVQILPQYSYDGSVNLIINDGINIPRLINSRFSATGKNTYEIVDRSGNSDTNIYDSGEQFDIDTSLYKVVSKIPKVELISISSGGQLKVGNYHFYFKLADADGNETDFIAESGLVSVFIGSNSFYSVHTGSKNENSTKQIVFKLTNLDTAYDYITVYYSRYTAEAGENMITEYMKIDKKYDRSNSKLVITGFEPTDPITVADINLQYNLVNSSQTSTICQNMLFLGNVQKQDIPYKELKDLSLKIYPKACSKAYSKITETYIASRIKETYIDPVFIYNNTGYWPNEMYRFGIVYILPNGELSPVFNIRGAIDITENSKVTSLSVYNSSGERQYEKYNENTHLFYDSTSKGVKYENSKGVCSILPTSTEEKVDYQFIYYYKFVIREDVREELSKYVKGYFIVRQTRIPLILAQGITIGIDDVSRTPTIPTVGGILTQLQSGLEKTHVETDDINGINYISEGFIRRYTFRFKAIVSGFWSKIGKIAGIAALVVGVAAASIITFGGAAAVTAIAGSAVAGVITGAGAVGGVLLGAAAGAAAGAIAGTAVTSAVASVQDIGYAVQRIGAKKRLNGRKTKAPKGYKIVETDESRLLTHEFGDRIIIKDSSKNKVQAIICPDYTVNQPYYNQIFTGNKHYIETDLRQPAVVEGYSNDCYFDNSGRHFYIGAYKNITSKISTNCEIVAIPDNTKATGINQTMFRSRAGSAEEAYKFEFVGTEYKDSGTKRIDADIIRGSFGPYLAFMNTTIGPAQIVNIYIPGYQKSNFQEYLGIRMDDSSSYNAVTDRFSIIEEEDITTNFLQTKNKDTEIDVFRGDCYLCQFTHRLNRNFNDPSAPYNDKIVKASTWKSNFDPDDTGKYANINLGDVNAIQLGMWVTFQLRSSNNLNIRTLDSSNVDETAMTGHPRGYYPYFPMNPDGVYKVQDSAIYNKGFTKSLGEKWCIPYIDAPYLKNWFGTRIMYSDIHINDGFKNGFRVFQGQNYRDYTREYGEIVRLISLESNILCVFEHGVALLPVNERAVAGQGAGGNIYINTSNVLPETPKIISDMYGSQWPESILKVPGKNGNSGQYVYGVDTVAKKIWRTDGNSLECISDFRVQEFLNNNITLGERELTPKIGIRNVKTLYNAFKQDVLFTFYDNTYGFEEKVWNLCWNELLQKFITFYSWVPSYMENINNIPFSFDRNTSKWIAKLGTSHAESSFADGITLSNVIIENEENSNGEVTDNFVVPISYVDTKGETKTKSYIIASGDSRRKYIGSLSLSNRVLPDSQVHYRIQYELERDQFGNYKKFEIVPLYAVLKSELDVPQETGELIVVRDQEKAQQMISENKIRLVSLPEDAMFKGSSVPLYCLKFKEGNDEYTPVYYRNGSYMETIKDINGNKVYTYKSMYNVQSLLSELYYRNGAGNSYSDYDNHKVSAKLYPISYKAKTWIANELVLNRLYFKNKNAIVGYATGYTKGIIGEAFPSGELFKFGTIEDLKANLTHINGKPYVYNTPLAYHWVIEETDITPPEIRLNLPIFKDITGKRLSLPRNEMINPDKIVTLLNIKAEIYIEDTENSNKLSDAYYNMKAGLNSNTSLIDAGYYQSVVGIAPRWNLQFLSTDFWKHGQAGIIDITDDIYPTYWYGKQHPFEFEFIVVNDPSIHKIFTNLEIVSNKAKPESFHYEVIGETYDFAKDKINMYFRQEAMKALWQYNSADITYDRNFLKVQPKQQPRSADLPHRYYTRQDTINDIEDYYIHITYPKGYDYSHLSGAEIVYYKNRQEYRIQNHAMAVCLDDLSQDDSRSIIAANCQYLEDRWKVTINPILVCYKNEYQQKISGSLIQPQNSTWTSSNRPKLPVMNSPIPDQVIETIQNKDGDVEIPEVLTDLGYSSSDIDTSNWLDDVNIYKYNFGEAHNRKEVDVRDKFLKVRIRYSGEELAVIDFLNTIYRISYS